MIYFQSISSEVLFENGDQQVFETKCSKLGFDFVDNTTYSLEKITYKHFFSYLFYLIRILFIHLVNNYIENLNQWWISTVQSSKNRESFFLYMFLTNEHIFSIHIYFFQTK